MEFEFVWHGPEPTEEWRQRAVEEATMLTAEGLETAQALIFHDVWDVDPDERPRIFMYGLKGDHRIHIKFLTAETDPPSGRGTG